MLPNELSESKLTPVDDDDLRAEIPHGGASGFTRSCAMREMWGRVVRLEKRQGIPTKHACERHRVVITGMGAITPIGHSVDEFWRNALAGASGAGRITCFDPSQYPTQIACETKGFDPARFIEPGQAGQMSRSIQFALAATLQALAQANLEISQDNGYDVGVLIGTGIGSLTDTEKETRVMIDRGGMQINPNFLPISLPDTVSGQVARYVGARGYNSCVSTACASGGHALGEALEVVRRGAADVMIAGGAESCICEIALAGFCIIRALSQRNDEPTKASRPFDLHRDGFVVGEGAGILVIESLEHALRRGAPILAEIVGYGCSCDAYHVTAPDPEGDGARRSMEAALADARLAPDVVGYINTHGTSTPLGDKAETLAIKSVFGERAYRIPINSTKSMVGHMIGAAGGVEAIATVQTIREGVIHPTINYDVPDPECDLDYVPLKAREARVDVGLSNSFGFGGHNASLVFSRFAGV